MGAARTALVLPQLPSPPLLTEEGCINDFEWIQLVRPPEEACAFVLTVPTSCVAQNRSAPSLLQTGADARTKGSCQRTIHHLICPMCWQECRATSRGGSGRLPMPGDQLKPPGEHVLARTPRGAFRHLRTPCSHAIPEPYQNRLERQYMHALRARSPHIFPRLIEKVASE